MVVLVVRPLLSARRPKERKGGRRVVVEEELSLADHCQLSPAIRVPDHRVEGLTASLRDGVGMEEERVRRDCVKR